MLAEWLNQMGKAYILPLKYTNIPQIMIYSDGTIENTLTKQELGMVPMIFQRSPDVHLIPDWIRFIGELKMDQNYETQKDKTK